ncbi:MAG: DUF3352 domain-containing protein [Chloroflexi bacterium]|nr:DUF3352 domain-containing protein [Chloroflexota bacterium]
MDQRDDHEATKATPAPPTPELAGVESATVEPGPADPAATQVVAATPGPPRSRARWLIGGGLALAAIAVLVTAVSFLGARPIPEALKYAPADSAIVVELRPELPGDQRQRLGNFLANFPGFADQSTLGQKIDEVLQRIVSESNADIDYATQVKPLLAGPMVVALGKDALSSMASGGSPDRGSVVVVATTDGTATCDSIFGATTAGKAHRGVEIRIAGDSTACAVRDRAMLIGTAASIGRALDARLDSSGIDMSAMYRTARAALQGDQLATVYAEGGALRAVLDSMSTVALANPASSLVGDWAIGGLRVVDDAIRFDAVADPVVGTAPSGAPTLAPAAESRFAGVLPADTLGFVEAHGVGALLERNIATMGADPGQAEALGQLQQGLAMLGGLDNVVGWIEELGVAVIPTGDATGGAILIRGTDAEAAKARVTQIRNLLVLAGTGTDITVSDVDRAGVTVTTVDLGNLADLAGTLGVPADSIGNARLTFSMARRDDLVIFAVGTGVVERILDTDASSSLRTSATFNRAMDLAGVKGDLHAYVALESAIGLVEKLGPADVFQGTWSTELKPYLEHLAAVAWSSSNVGTTNTSSFVLTVK